MSSRRALLTGAGGFVGARLAERLLAEGITPCLVVRPGSDPWRLTGVRGDVEIREVDLRDRVAIRAAIAACDPEWIFHLAAHGAYSWQEDPQAIFETNLTGTLLLARAAMERGFDSFVHAGSSSEYGFKDHAPGEDEAPEPNSWYAVAKAAATLLGQHLAQQRDQPVVTLRLSSVYGPWEEPQRLVPTLISKGLAGTLPPLVSPDTGRDFVYVDDVCDAFLAVARAGRTPHPIYNVGSGRQTTVRELVEIARAELAIDVDPDWGGYEPRQWDARVWVSDPGRIEHDLGWRATCQLGTGFARTVAWLRERPELWSRYGVA